MYATIGLQVSIEPGIKYEGFGGNFWWGALRWWGARGPGPLGPPPLNPALLLGIKVRLFYAVTN